MKKLLTLCTMVMCIVLLGGCGTKNETIKWETSTLNDCKKGCDMLANETTKKQDCYTLCETSQKLESNDISDCEDIDKKSNNFITKDICIQDKAIQAKNPKFCESISETGLKDTCYMWLASEMKDITVCNAIKDTSIKSACTATK